MIKKNINSFKYELLNEKLYVVKTNKLKVWKKIKINCN